MKCIKYNYIQNNSFSSKRNGDFQVEFKYAISYSGYRYESFLCLR